MLQQQKSTAAAAEALFQVLHETCAVLAYMIVAPVKQHTPHQYMRICASLTNSLLPYYWCWVVPVLHSKGLACKSTGTHACKAVDAYIIEGIEFTQRRLCTNF